MKKILTKKGFTLIELIVVIAILAILAAILIPSLTGYLQRAEAARDEANARAYYSEVALAAAVGDDPTTIVEPADLTCSFTWAAGSTVVSDFTCDNAAGDGPWTFQ